jgi:hypothetical protein
MIAIGQREWMVAEREQELQEKEEEVVDTLERRCNELSSREVDLNTREATVEADQKRMGELRMSLLAHKLATDLQTNNLDFRQKELADREELAEKEKWLAEKQL